MDKLTITVLNNTIENNQNMLDFMDLTNKEKEECIKEIERCKQLIVKIQNSKNI